MSPDSGGDYFGHYFGDMLGDWKVSGEVSESSRQRAALGNVALETMGTIGAWLACMEGLIEEGRSAESLVAPAMRHLLSPRETDVLRLVAAGRTNAEVENIYRKTGAASRTAASAWAIRNGLA